MDMVSVQNSKLHITQTGGASFTIPIQEAIDNNWVDVTWAGNTDRPNRIVRLTVDPDYLDGGNLFKLASNTEYKLQMVDNQAAGTNGLPLILGGAIDLLNGFEFKTTNATDQYQYPEIVFMTPGPDTD